MKGFLTIQRKIFDVYAFPGLLKGHVWELIDHHYYYGDVNRRFAIELPLGKVLNTVDSMVSISTAIVKHYERNFNEKIYFIPVDFVQGEVINWGDD
jgi:hypothetical protein